MFGSIRKVLVTGPHRSGTTIATEIIAAELGLPAIRECDLAHPRFEGDTEPDLCESDIRKMKEGVLQGATTFRWLPEVADYFDAVVVVVRNPEDIIASQIRYRGRQLDNPTAKYSLLKAMKFPLVVWVEYETLSKHPLFYKDRKGWKPRQTSP
ncbi:MAG: hypothetical protein IH825_07435 [Candidatus Marinimicrobia bacterium]|nr:hypothetical protein [Candidatus Neomarinimicrobiota bacterium]